MAPTAVNENPKNRARAQLAPYHSELEELFDGENYHFHSGYARLVQEVASGKWDAAEAVRRAKKLKEIRDLASK